MKRFNAKQWIATKVNDIADPVRYPQTREQTLELLRQLIIEGDYDDELDYRQTIAAIEAIHFLIER